jgi:DNA repair photolyase
MSRRTSNPPNRFGEIHVQWDGEAPRARLQVSEDHSREILVHNDSPDVGFSWSVNPYRGCTHACAYCYARNFHEYLGLGAGTDFESRILVKPRAPALLERAFRRSSWKGELVAFSGVTDCYQPLERRYRLTRGCLEVCRDFRNPVSIVTRSDLVVRDLDILVQLHAVTRLTVTFSIPILDPKVCRAIEPGAPEAADRLRAMRVLSRMEIPVGVLVAPVIAGITEREVPRILEAAREAGACSANLLLLRLPGAVATVFEERLRAVLPRRAGTILARHRRLRGTRQGDWDRNRSQSKEWAALEALFHLWRTRLGYEGFPDGPLPDTFRRPLEGRQLDLLEQTVRPS